MIYGDLDLPNLESLVTSNNFRNTGINRILNLGKVTVISQSAFSNCASLQDVNFSDSIESIGVGAFDSCGKLSLDIGTLPKSISTLGNSCFYKCSKVYGEINLPNLTGQLGAQAFNGTSVTKVNDLGTVTDIGNSCFGECLNLKKIVFPETVTYVDNQMLRNNENYVVLIFKSTVPCTIGKDFFVGFKGKYKIYVPDDSVEAYRQASFWLNWATHIFPMSEYVEGEEDVTE